MDGAPWVSTLPIGYFPLVRDWHTENRVSADVFVGVPRRLHTLQHRRTSLGKELQETILRVQSCGDFYLLLFVAFYFLLVSLRLLSR